MRTKIFWITSLVFGLISCTPPAETATAAASSTPILPTSTALPRYTAAPRMTNTPRTPRIELLRSNLLDAVASELLGIEHVSSVSRVRFNEGALEIKLETKSLSQDQLTEVSWVVVRMFSTQLVGIGKETLEAVAGGPPAIALTIFTAEGNYRYESVTDWDTLTRLAAKTISSEEWMVLSEAKYGPSGD